ncbi:MAG TPA: Ppx/GppA phosphatase family protein [Rhizomicrobium sp.]|nr:Ppx/GppA phosphatase family protein [Rhizomicrobium sp.]
MHGRRPPGRKSSDPRPDAPALAVLDLGTNNCRLLIARPTGDERFRAVDSFSRIVRLGEGVATSGRISDEAMERTIDALKICALHIARSKAVHVRAIATQAARLAKNADILIARARAETGIELEVISAETEADLAALGCAPLIGHKYKGALIFDIGGGSTEVIHLMRQPGGDFEKKFAASLPFGVVTLSESYGAAAQSRAGFEKMQAAMRDSFAPYAGHGFDAGHEHLLGTSGTVTTLAALALRLPRYQRAKVDGSWHETSHISRIVERIAGLDVASLARLGPIGPERADLMLAGSAIFAAICALWPSRMLRVADRGLREGMLRQMRQELEL